MKRSLITWDENELPRAALTARLERARECARAADVSVIVLFTDVWRSNHGRHLVNFMPFWGSSLVAVPVEGEPILICGNSPRVYPWIRTITIVDDIRPAKNLAERFLALARERDWRRVGVVDRVELPFEIYHQLQNSGVDVVDIDASAILVALDEHERAMHQTAVDSIRRHVEQSAKDAEDHTEHELVARLEKALRGAGMEDLVVRVSDGRGAPRPAAARRVTQRSSVAVASEYRGHWAFVSRPIREPAGMRVSFLAALADLRSLPGGGFDVFDLSGPFPFQMRSPSSGPLIAVHVRDDAGLYYGDTCIRQSDHSALLL